MEPDTVEYKVEKLQKELNAIKAQMQKKEVTLGDILRPKRHTFNDRKLYIHINDSSVYLLVGREGHGYGWFSFHGFPTECTLGLMHDTAQEALDSVPFADVMEYTNIQAGLTHFLLQYKRKHS